MIRLIFWAQMIRVIFNVRSNIWPIFELLNVFVFFILEFCRLLLFLKCHFRFLNLASCCRALPWIPVLSWSLQVLISTHHHTELISLALTLFTPRPHFSTWRCGASCSRWIYQEGASSSGTVLQLWWSIHLLQDPGPKWVKMCRFHLICHHIPCMHYTGMQSVVDVKTQRRLYIGIYISILMENVIV